MDYLGPNIRFLRKRAGMSQADLAKIVGKKSFSTIQHWETGKTEPNVGELKIIAELYMVDLEDLLTKCIETSNQKTERLENESEYDQDALEIAKELKEEGYGELNILFKKVRKASAEDKKRAIDVLKAILPKSYDD